MRAFLASSQEKQHDVELVPTQTPLGETSLHQILAFQVLNYASECRSLGLRSSSFGRANEVARRESEGKDTLGDRKCLKHTPLLPRLEQMPRGDTRVAPLTHTHTRMRHHSHPFDSCSPPLLLGNYALRRR